MNIEEGKTTQLSADIRDDLSLEMLGSELKSSERRKSQSEEDLKEVGYIIDIGEKL